jgi:hypothetical protein
VALPLFCFLYLEQSKKFFLKARTHIAIPDFTSKSIRMNGNSFSLPVRAIQDSCENAFQFLSLKTGMFGWKCLDYSCD